MRLFLDTKNKKTLERVNYLFLSVFSVVVAVISSEKQKLLKIKVKIIVIAFVSAIFFINIFYKFSHKTPVNLAGFYFLFEEINLAKRNFYFKKAKWSEILFTSFFGAFFDLLSFTAQVCLTHLEAASRTSSTDGGKALGTKQR